MIDVITFLISLIYQNLSIQICLGLLIFYLIYYLKYGNYIFIQKNSYTQGKHRIGKTLPAYPNGWYIILRSHELKKGESKYVDIHGESLVVFRGNNGKSYVLNAYCPHLGANLGVDGRVVHDSCVQCPFHAWTFDGETGNCVMGKDKIQKEGIKYEYVFDSQQSCEFKPTKTEKIKIRKYYSKEHSGYIYVWFSSKVGERYDHESENNTEEERRKFTTPYEPLDLTEHLKRLHPRGHSVNKINAHVSDIAENGGDMLHFLYVHTNIIPYLVKGSWDAQWIRGDDPQLYEKMTLSSERENTFRMNLLNKFLNEKNKKHIGVISLRSKLTILNTIRDQHFFTLTGFQLGSGIVYLFIQGTFFEVMFVQYVETKEKYQQTLYHDIYCNWETPYWLSALQLRLETGQVLNDGVIWDNKKFGYTAYFNKKTNECDSYLIKWRQWFIQFYDGCEEEEEKKNSLQW